MSTMKNVKNPTICGIYKIINTINNKLYVGQSRNILSRFATHRRKLNKKQHYNLKLQHSWDEYGSDCFKFEIIELTTIDKLTERELYWIYALGALNRETGFNLLINGHIARRGVDVASSNKKRFTFTHLDGTVEPNITIIELAIKHNIGDATTIHRMVRGEVEVACGWFVNEPTNPIYRYVELWNKDGRYIKQRRILLPLTNPEFKNACFRNSKPQNRIGDWFNSKELRDKRVKSVINDDGMIIKNIFQCDFVKLAGVNAATAQGLWSGKHKKVAGWEVYEGPIITETN